MGRLLIAGALALLTVAPASAAVIDFEGVPSGNNPNPLVLPGATFTTAGGFNYVVNAATNVLCPSTSADNAGDCPLDLDVAFDAPAATISLAFVGNNELAMGADIGDVQIFSGAVLLGTVDVLVGDNQSFSKDLVPLTGFANVTRLRISSTDFGGLAYDDFTFEEGVRAAEPATLALFGFGALATGAVRRRRVR